MPNVLALDFENSDATQPALEAVKNSLSAGGVIAFPTDTFYGLGADPFNIEAIQKLFHLKQRPPSNPILVLIHNESQLGLFTKKIDEQAKKLIQEFWPGPLTLLFQARSNVPDSLTADTGKIGIRLPGSSYTRRLLEEIGHPLTATSANLSEGKNPSIVDDIPQSLTAQLDFIIDAGPSQAISPSTVVDPGSRPLSIIREGAISASSIESLFS